MNMQLRPYRSVTAYESRGVIYLETHWQTTVGVSIGQEPVFAVARQDLPELDAAIRACLNGVRKGVPHPTDWKKVVRPLFAIAPFKSDRALMAVAKSVYIVDFDDHVEMFPDRNEGTRNGFRSDGKTRFACRLDDNLAVKLAEALDQATFANGSFTESSGKLTP
jgi:hypothetical protein